MPIRFFFEYDKQIIQLPVNPQSLAISSSGNNRTEEVVKLGEINIIRQPKLQECSIKCFLPSNSNGPFVLTAGQFKQPQFYIDFFNNIRNTKKPCRFIISDTKINMLVSIEDFDWNIEAGDDDVYYTLKLKEYKTYSAKVVKVTPSNTNTTTANKQTNTQRAPVPATFSIGDMVVVNGKYTADSYGGGSFGTFTNFTGKISHIVADKNRARRYHITTTSGGWRGWVSDKQISHK